MKKYFFLIIFTAVTGLNVLLLFAFGKVNSPPDKVPFREALDFSRQYDVKLDIEYLKNNFNPAYE